MRILTILITAAVVGTVAGGTWAYIEVLADRDLPAVSPAETASPKGPVAEEKTPRAVVDETTYQFGTMQRGTKKSHNFLIKNLGTAPLSLRVETSCKCTVAQVTNNIAPGESGNLLLEWTSSDNGPFRQSATIFTNDPLNSRIELTIEGTVTAATGIEPPDFLFDKITFGEAKSAEVFIMSMLHDEVVISDAQISDPDSRDKFEIKIEPVERESLPNPLAKAGVRIALTTKPDLPVGRLHQSLVLRTNLPEAEHLEIPLVGRVIGDIRVHGPGWNEEEGVLLLGKIRSDEGRKARLIIAVRGANAAGVRFAVQSVDPPELKVTIGEPKPLRDTLLHVPVEIEVPAGTRPMVRLHTAQGDEGRIVLSTTHDKIKELVLGVRFAVER